MTAVSNGRVGISLLAFSPDRLAGAGTYTMGLTRALVSRAPERYTVFLPARHEPLWREVLAPGVEIVVCGPDPDRRVTRVGFEQARLPALALRHGVETLYFPHLFVPVWSRPRSAVTIYDLLLLSRRTNFAWHKRLYHRWAYRHVGQRAAHIVTISQFCRREIVERLGIAPQRITVATPGIDPEFVEDKAPRAAPLDLPARYLLAVAGSYPHKRLRVVLEAFEIVGREQPDLHLVLAGTQPGEQGLVPAIVAPLEGRGVAPRVHVLPRLDRAALVEVFRRAQALVSASEFEGFGIPILEAMAVGCPVAASPAAGVVEVLGGYGWVATGWSAAALAVALRGALKAARGSEGTLQSARERARATFTWSHSAEAVEAALGTSDDG